MPLLDRALKALSLAKLDGDLMLDQAYFGLGFAHKSGCNLVDAVQ